MSFPRRAYAPWPAAPGNAATILLFNTHDKVVTGGSAVSRATRVAGMDNELAVTAVEIVWHRNDQASDANGIRLYALDDTETWRETDCKDDLGAATIGSAAPQAVGALTTGQERRILIDVSRYRGSAIEYTAGATGPTQWNGTIIVHFGAEAIQR